MLRNYVAPVAISNFHFYEKATREILDKVRDQKKVTTNFEIALNLFDIMNRGRILNKGVTYTHFTAHSQLL